MTNSKPQIKKQKIMLIAKKPRKIKAALKAWAESSDKVDSDPLKLDEAPQWVEMPTLKL